MSEMSRSRGTLPTGQETLKERWYYYLIKNSGEVQNGTGENPPSGFTGAGCKDISIGWIDYTPRNFAEEAAPAAKELGFSEQLTLSLKGLSRSGYEDFDTEMGINIPVIEVGGDEVEVFPFWILIRENLVFTAHPYVSDERFVLMRRYIGTFLTRIVREYQEKNRLTVFLIRILHENIDWNIEHLRVIEERSDNLNEMMTDASVPREKIAPQIYQIKHDLIIYLNALWDTLHVLHTLSYGDAELITDDEDVLNRLKGLSDEMDNHIVLAEHMSDVVASGLEVMQTIYNNQLQILNNRLAVLMSYLTIIGTAVLIPNTLATVLGVSVFELTPQDLGWYLAVIIGSTVVGTALVGWWVIRRGWIPPKVD